MFIKIEGVNFFVIPDNKTPEQIANEIFLRMPIRFLSNYDRSQILKQVLEQL